MYTTVSRWGNSQGIRLPKSLLEALGLQENDRVELSCQEDVITIRKASAPTHRTLAERLTAFYQQPLDKIEPIHTDEVDWGKREGHEIW